MSPQKRARRTNGKSAAGRARVAKPKAAAAGKTNGKSAAGRARVAGSKATRARKTRGKSAGATRTRAKARTRGNGKSPASRNGTGPARGAARSLDLSRRPGRAPAAAKPSPAVATFSREAVAALFIERQHLDRPRGQTLDPANLTHFAEDVGGIQIDSINVLERAHHLTLWSRFGAYDRAALEQHCYGERVLFEYWAHAACLVPSAHLRWWRRAMLDYQSRHTGWTAWLRRNTKMMRAIEDAVRERGPLGNSDFQQRRPGGKSGWWSWKPATHALHFNWMTGRFLIHSRKHFQKRFDLAERLMPEIATLEPPGKDEFMRWHIERSLHAMGAATELDLRLYLSFPYFERGGRKKALDAMVRSGEVVEVGVAGDRARWYALARDLPALENAATRATPEGTALLAPFDSFLWHRARTLCLFGFDYRIEVYTPGHKRVHGYYTLPIYHQGQLIGRLDAKNHRVDHRLEVRNVSLEDWFVKSGTPPAASWGAIDRDRALAGLGETLWSLAAHLGADRVDVIRVTPSRLLAAVRAAVRETRPVPATTGS